MKDISTWDAMEIVVGDLHVAWTVDDEVYVHTGDTSQRDDGYVLIGMLEWEADHKTAMREQIVNEERLREFVRVWLYGSKLIDPKSSIKIINRTS